MPSLAKTRGVESAGLLARASRYRRLLALLASVAAAGMLWGGPVRALADEPSPSPSGSVPIEPSEPPQSSPEPSGSPTGGESPASSEEPPLSATEPDGWTRQDIDAALTGVVCVAFMASLATLAALGK